MNKNIKLLVENIFDEIDDINSDDSLLNTITMSAIHQKQAEEEKRIIKLIETGNNKELCKIAVGNFVIPKSATKIGKGAFYECNDLTSVTIPNLIPRIGDWTFYGCSKLTSVIISDSVTEIDLKAFSKCESLTSVTIGNSVTEIGEQAFSHCECLTKVTIPKSVERIGDRAFYSCSGLTSVTWNAKNCARVSAPFEDTNITVFEFGNEVEKIPPALCWGLTDLTSITIPASVTEIGDRAFRDCSSLKSITIPNSVDRIGEYAFAGCKNLTSVNIYNSAVKIDKHVFDGCSEQLKINYLL